MKHVVIPTHHFTRTWECHDIKAEVPCTSWTAHQGCGFVYRISMTEAAFEQLRSYEDINALSYWKRD